MFRSKLILILVFEFLFLVSLLAYGHFFKRDQLISTDIAQSINKSCKTSESRICFGNFFYAYAKTHYFSDTYHILNELKKINPEVQYCHTIAHQISIAEVEKDPQGWLNVFTYVPPEECSYGFFHGIIEGKYSSDPQLKVNSTLIDSICNSELAVKTGFPRAARSCAHAFGHILLLQSEGEIEDALGNCQGVSKEIQSPCRQGVFMEHIQKNNLVDHGIEAKPIWNRDYLEKEKKFCKTAGKSEQDECWQSLGPLINSVDKYDYLTSKNECEDADSDSSKRICNRELLGQIFVKNFSEGKRISEDYCAFNNDYIQSRNCLKDVIEYVLLTSKGFKDNLVGYCSRINDQNKSFCLEELGKYK